MPQSARAAKTQRDLTPLKRSFCCSKHLEALEDHQGSPCPFIAPVFLSAPCSSSSSSNLFPFHTTRSVRALGGCLITLMHAHADRNPRSGDASFSFRSCRQRLPRRARTHCKVMLKYFRRKCSQYSRTGLALVWLRHRIPKPIFFVFEKKRQQGSNERITQTKLNAVINLVLCEKLISSFTLRKKKLFFSW